MTIEEAFQRLKEAGLHVRTLDNGSLIGGSHVDASGLISVVENSYLIQPTGEGLYGLSTGRGDELGLTLTAAVDRVIETVKPQPNIPASVRPAGSGPCLY